MFCNPFHDDIIVLACYCFVAMEECPQCLVAVGNWLMLNSGDVSTL